MRILRLDLGTGQSVDLHPFISVVTGLEADERSELIDAIGTLGAGSTTGIRGLLQHQGILVELDGSTAHRLGAATDANLVVDTAAADAVHGTNWLRDRIDDQLRATEIAAVRLEELRADLAPSSKAKLDAIDRKMGTDDERGRAEATKLRRAIKTASARLAALQPTIVRAPDGLFALRDRMAAQELTRTEVAKHLDELDDAVVRAQERLEVAKAALDRSTAEAVPALLTREQEARLEQLSYPQNDSSRKGKWRKMLRPEEQVEMERLLAKVGVESWTAYTMYRTEPTVPRAKLENVEQCKVGVAEAQDHLASVKLQRDADEQRAEIAAEDAAIKAELGHFLGPVLPNDIDAALEALTSTEANPEWPVAVRALASALDEATVPNPGVDEPQGLLDAARRILDATRDGAEVDALMAQRGRLAADYERHCRAMQALEEAEVEATTAALGLARLEEQLAASGGDEATGVDAILAAVEPIAIQVALEGNGSVPIVLVGEIPVSADREVERLMSRLVEIAESLQVILVTNRTAVGDWAMNVGLDKAMITRARVRAGEVAEVARA